MVETVFSILGDYATVLPLSLLLNSKNGATDNERASLHGKRLVTASETPSGGRLNENSVKSLTGGDTLRGRHMYKEAFTFRPQFLPLISTNHKPEILGTDAGIWSRVALIPFQVNFEAVGKMDPALRVTLAREHAGILRWLVEGCLLYQEFGLGKPPAVVAATDEYRTNEDRVASFVAEHLDLTEPNADVAFAEVFERYKQACSSSNLRALGDRKFGAELDRVLRDHGRRRVDKTQGKVCEGVKLKPAFDSVF
jgi:putative DNA primase/helicase